MINKRPVVGLLVVAGVLAHPVAEPGNNVATAIVRAIRHLRYRRAG